MLENKFTYLEDKIQKQIENKIELLENKMEAMEMQVAGHRKTKPRY